MSKRKPGERLQLVESDQFKRHINRAIELINKGWRSTQVFADIVSVWPEHNSWFHDVLMRKAYEQIRNTLHKDREYIFQLHMNRYEELYQQAMIMEDHYNRPLEIKRDWKVISYKLQTALKILKQKEELIGLHNKDVVIEIENNNTTVINDKSGGIVLMKLTLDERIELLNYLRQARTVPIEGERQILIKTKNTSTVQAIEKPIDVEYEEMPDKVIDKMIDDKGVAKIHYIEAPMIEDFTNPNESGKTLREVQQSIDDGIKSKFEKLMKRTVKK